MSELTNHPYFSSKSSVLTVYRKAWHCNLSHEGERQDTQRAQEQEGAPHLKEACILGDRLGGIEAGQSPAGQEKESRRRPVPADRYQKQGLQDGDSEVIVF